MRIPSYLADTTDRTRFMDLSMSLYESLCDLLTDLNTINDDTTPHDRFDPLTHRISMSAMNCLGDIELLSPILRELQAMRFPD